MPPQNLPVWVLPFLSIALVSVTVPLVASTTVPTGIVVAAVSGTNLFVPGRRTSRSPLDSPIVTVWPTTGGVAGGRFVAPVLPALVLVDGPDGVGSADPESVAGGVFSPGGSTDWSPLPASDPPLSLVSVSGWQPRSSAAVACHSSPPISADGDRVMPQPSFGERESSKPAPTTGEVAIGR